MRLNREDVRVPKQVVTFEFWADPGVLPQFYGRGRLRDEALYAALGQRLDAWLAGQGRGRFVALQRLWVDDHEGEPGEPPLLALALLYDPMLDIDNWWPLFDREMDPEEHAENQALLREDAPPEVMEGLLEALHGALFADLEVEDAHWEPL